MTTNENLLAFDSLTQAYAAEKSGLTSNLKSGRQFDIGETREKGAGYLELTAPTELLSAKALSMSGIKLSDIGSIGSDALSGLKSGVQSFTDAASESYDQISTYINNLYNNMTSEYNMYRFNGTSLEPELDPEFGVSADDAMVAVGQAGRPVAAGVESALTQAPTEASVAGATEVGTEATVSAGEAAGEVATDAAAGSLEGVGAALDSTGIGAPIGLIVGLAGIGLGGFSLFDGIKDIFSHRSDAVTLPNLNVPNFQAT
mgnify:CR=1 FL=1